MEKLRQQVSQCHTQYCSIEHPLFNVPITQGTEEAMKKAEGYMKRYGQIQLNPDHIIHGILETPDPLTESILQKYDTERIALS
jgi:hypothetical protein